MRITSELFVAQLTRRLFAAGGFAAVVRRGADMAGAIFVLQRTRDGSLALYSPAVQSMAGESGARRFMHEPADSDADVEQRFAREARFDPDFWVVEVETEEIADYLDIAEDG